MMSRPASIGARASFATGAAGFLRKAWRRAGQWWHNKRAIAQLEALDDRMLKDIGIERSQIESAVDGTDHDRSSLLGP
jgi:uncharacterized protein YjiS (DUF1127 family)